MLATAPRTDDLAVCLADEARLYAELLELGAREREAVVGRDPADLNAIVAEKARVIAAIGRAETTRESWIAAWSAANGRGADGLTLTTVMAELPPGEIGAIAPLRDLLLARLRDVARMNHDNGHLVQSALRIVSRSIETFARISQELGYQPSGARVHGGQTAVLDYRV